MPATQSGKAIAAVLAIAFLYGAAGSIAAEISSIDKVAGVYKRAQHTTDVNGDVYAEENVLEVVKLSPTTAYFRAHLTFANFHVCNIWGVAVRTAGELVYRGTDTDYYRNVCVLHVKIDGSKLVFDDENGACRLLTCGARGLYSSSGRPTVTFDLSSRRKIRYMPTLLASWQYAEALTEYAATGGAAAATASKPTEPGK